MMSHLGGGRFWQMAAPFESFEAFLAAADVRCSEAQAHAIPCLEFI